MQKRISIITGAGGHLGSGHLQRMANLADFILRESTHEVYLVMAEGEKLLPPSLRSLCVDSPPPTTSLIIRDMRDSTFDEITALRRVAPVIAIDDCGSGRNLADIQVDLLPNPYNSMPRNDLFLFGHSFTESMRSIHKRRIRKTIDVALYCGFQPKHETIESLFAIVPDGLTCAILAGDDSRLIDRGRTLPLAGSCAETLLASRVLISHFGITLYEGHLAGCRLVSINPTGYHASLVDKVGSTLNPINLGILPISNPSNAATIILDAAQNPPVHSIEPAMAFEEIARKLQNFLTFISETPGA